MSDTNGQPTSKATIDSNGMLTATGSNGTVLVTATADDEFHTQGVKTIVIKNQIVKIRAIAVTGKGGQAAISQKGGSLKMYADVQPYYAANAQVQWKVTYPSDQPCFHLGQRVLVRRGRRHREGDSPGS